MFSHFWFLTCCAHSHTCFSSRSSALWRGLMFHYIHTLVMFKHVIWVHLHIWIHTLSYIYQFINFSHRVFTREISSQDVYIYKKIYIYNICIYIYIYRYIYIYNIYIALILLLWVLSTLCVVGSLMTTYIYIYIYIFIYIFDVCIQIFFPKLTFWT